MFQCVRRICPRCHPWRHRRCVIHPARTPRFGRNARRSALETSSSFCACLDRRRQFRTHLRMILSHRLWLNDFVPGCDRMPRPNLVPEARSRSSSPSTSLVAHPRNASLHLAPSPRTAMGCLDHNPSPRTLKRAHATSVFSLTAASRPNPNPHCVRSTRARLHRSPQ